MNKIKKHTNIVAIIPARGGSKGIPRKNIINFCGKPLMAWTIEQAAGSRYVDKVYVTSDNKEILGVAKRYGAEIIRRPKELSADTSSSEEAILHAVSEIEKTSAIDAVVFLQATSPLRDSADIDMAVEKFFAENADSLFSAAILEDFCVWGYRNNVLKSITFDHRNRGRRQERTPYYLENGSMYVFKPGILRKYNNRLGGKIAMCAMDYWKSCEIDKTEDLEICEYFMRNKVLKNRRTGRRR